MECTRPSPEGRGPRFRRSEGFSRRDLARLRGAERQQPLLVALARGRHGLRDLEAKTTTEGRSPQHQRATEHGARSGAAERGGVSGRDL